MKAVRCIGDVPQGWIPAIVAGGLLVIALAQFALGAPPEGADPNSPIAAWYRSLKAPNGDICCSVADCRPVEARLHDGHWEIADNDQWVPVPDAVVLKRENLDGRPIACRWGGQIRCFIPPYGV